MERIGESKRENSRNDLHEEGFQVYGEKERLGTVIKKEAS